MLKVAQEAMEWAMLGVSLLWYDPNQEDPQNNQNGTLRKNLEIIIFCVLLITAQTLIVEIA